MKISSPKSRKVASPKSRKVASPKFRTVSPKMSNLPNELLEMIYDNIPNLKDRVALASTSTQMRSVGVTAYGSAEHIINKASDIDLAIRHRAS